MTKKSPFCFFCLFWRSKSKPFSDAIKCEITLNFPHSKGRKKTGISKFLQSFHTALFRRKSSLIKILTGFLLIEIHFYPPLQTPHDATSKMANIHRKLTKWKTSIENWQFFPITTFSFWNFSQKMENENVAMGKNCQF